MTRFLSEFLAVGLATMAGAGSARAQARVDFPRQILPILEGSCITCHRAPYETSMGRTVQPRGGLRLDGREWILVGGLGGAAVVPGSPDASALYTRITLPGDDPDRMPNQGDSLTDSQQELISRWITEGSSFGRWNGAEGPGAEAVAKAQAMAVAESRRTTTGLQIFEELAVGMTPPLQQAVNKAATVECQVVPVVPGSALLRATFVSNVGSVTNESLDRLQPLAGYITQLGLGRTRVTDEALQPIGRMSKLTRLDLHGTAVTDAGLQQLVDLLELRYLNLHSTAVTDRGIATIGRLRNLTAVYLWNTKVTDTGAALLRELLPEAKISYVLELTAAPAQTGRRRRRR